MAISLTGLKYFQIPDVGLGLFSDVNPLQIPVGGASECSNLVWVDGFLQPRPGIATAYGPPPNALSIAHLALFTNFEAINRLMRLSRNGANFELHQHSGSWSAVSVAVPGSSVAYQPTSCNFKGSWWFTTGDGDLFKYDGTTLSSVPSLQADAALKCYDKPKIVVAGDSRLFIGDCVVDGTRITYRVAWSDFLDGKIWRGGVGAGSSGYCDLPKSSSPITGMFYTNSTLIVFKPTSIFIGYAAPSPLFYTFKEIVSGIGCTCHATIKQYREGILVWLGDDNIYVGGISKQPQAVGDRIRPRLRQVIALSNISAARACIDRQNHLYTLYLPEAAGTYAGKVVRFFTINLRNGSWWEGSFNQPSVDITDGLEFRTDSWQTTQLLASADGRIFESSFANLNDLGVEFSVSWVSGVLTGRSVTGNSTDEVSLQMVRVNGPSGQMGFVFHTGRGLDRFVPRTVGTQLLDGTSNIYASGRPTSAEHFKIQLTHPTASNAADIATLGVGFVPQGANVKK